MGAPIGAAIGCPSRGKGSPGWHGMRRRCRLPTPILMSAAIPREEAVRRSRERGSLAPMATKPEPPPYPKPPRPPTEPPASHEEVFERMRARYRAGDKAALLRLAAWALASDPRMPKEAATAFCNAIDRCHRFVALTLDEAFNVERPADLKPRRRRGLG
jgi:hypothetical protein